jgi:hypothetical protein
MAPDQLASDCLLSPKDQTDWDGSGHGWACLLIRGSGPDRAANGAAKGLDPGGHRRTVLNAASSRHCARPRCRCQLVNDELAEQGSTDVVPVACPIRRSVTVFQGHSW